MFAPPALSALAGRLVGALPHRSFASPTVNLAITNVPGSRQQMYLAGRPLEASYPVLTINELSPLHIGLQSGPDVDRRRRRCLPRHDRQTSTRSSSGCPSSSTSSGGRPSRATAPTTTILDEDGGGRA